jgi:hypothetical protein
VLATAPTWANIRPPAPPHPIPRTPPPPAGSTGADPLPRSA